MWLRKAGNSFCPLFILQNMCAFSFYRKTLNNRKDITIYFWCHQSTKMFFYDPFICVQKRRKKSPQKNHHFCSKAISKASPATPRSGTICWVLYSGKSWQKSPAGGYWTKIQGVPTLRIRFYTLEKVGKRLLPAGSGQKYRVVQLREYFSWILIL